MATTLGVMNTLNYRYYLFNLATRTKTTNALKDDVFRLLGFFGEAPDFRGSVQLFSAS